MARYSSLFNDLNYKTESTILLNNVTFNMRNRPLQHNILQNELSLKNDNFCSLSDMFLSELKHIESAPCFMSYLEYIYDTRNEFDELDDFDEVIRFIELVYDLIVNPHRLLYPDLIRVSDRRVNQYGLYTVMDYITDISRQYIDGPEVDELGVFEFSISKNSKVTRVDIAPQIYQEELDRNIYALVTNSSRRRRF